MNVHESLMAQLQARATFGQQKYGKDLEPWNGHNPAIDALEELFDLFVYLEQLRLERGEVRMTLRTLCQNLERVIETGDYSSIPHIAEVISTLGRLLSQDVPRIGYPAKEEETP